ncbi:MAG: amino acid adenylation domain-containing protein, partial [Methylococcales bacterium]|nr:amino acid adenylation domain-containing protein [Methylococcales bacterium]
TAIAGGINLTIHPKKYLGLSSAQIVGSHPDSTSFGDGDGYIPAETVGAVLLKPLAAAIADNDTILAVIKSTAINHGGQSNGYSVPNSSAQTDLIVGNFARAEIDPRTISYVESAANGSPLGDAIELKALTAGFQQYTAEQQFCAIGSAKANIGHAEAASGMSQLIKVVLQLQHQQLVPTIKAEPLNPEISFEQTPFYLQRQLEPWYRPIIDGQGECLRLATVSSFGAGGSNAHLIVEEYEPVSQQEPVIDKTNSSQLMLFSARTAEQLHVVVRNMLAFIEQQPELPLDNLAYTLQTGREVMAYRMALVVDDQDQLIHGLQAYLENNSGSSENIFSGDQEQDNSDIKNLLLGETGQSILQLLLAEKDLSKLAVYWVKGVKIVWQPMYQNQTLHRIALPSYPFDKKSYWLGGKPLSADAPLLIAAEQEAMAIDPDPLRPILDNIQHYLITRLSQELGIPVSEISMSKNLQDYGADSMFAMKLRHGLDEVFQLKISTKDLLLHDTLISLAEYCLTKAPKQLKKNNSKLSADDKTLESQVTTQPLTSPLSEGQKGLWLLHQFNPQMSAYNVPIALRFKAGLNRSVFQRACKYILQYYPLLGATFQQNNGELYQTLIPETHLCFEHENIDLTDEADIVELLREKSKQAFDLAHGSLFRVHLFSPTQADETYVLITVHHIVFDGSSAVLLIKALMQAYQQLVAGTILALKPVQTSYFDFVQWQQQFLAGEQGLAQLNYWKSQLSGDLPVLSLPCDHKRPAVQRFKGASYELMLTPELSGKVKALAKSLRVNLSVLFLGVLNMLLHRYSGDEDILIGMPILGRPESRFEQIIGYFINMIVIRCQISGQQGFSDLLNSLQMTVADGVDNSDYPFPTLLKELNVSRDQARSPLFQVTYAYQNFLQPNDLLSDEMAIPVEFLSGINQEGSHDFTLEVYQGAEQFLLKIDYNTDLFKAGTIARIMTHYSNLLSSVIAQPDVNIADHELLSAQEKQQFLSKWNICEIDYDKEQSIVELFQQQVQQNPGSTALLFEGQQLSYKELDQHSSKLANYLLNSGVTENDLVGVCMDRSLHMVVAMLAIFKAGAVYVPIVPSDPEQRIQYLLDNSKIKVLITEEKLQEKFADLLSASACSSFAIDTQWQAILASETDLIPTVKLSQAAYVIYTSGSTGQPKGVVISHGALSHHCQVMGDYYQLTPADKVLQFASINVDASLEQLLPALLVGATVVIRPNELWSSQAFRSKVMELDISVVDVPPSYLYELLLDTRSEAEWAAVASLKLIITGGEVLSVETVKLWRISPLRDCRLLNAYGPTETTITSTVFEVDAENPAAATASTIPIGRPLVNESVYILDAYDQPVPVGVSGEMHIGGAGLAIGYLNQPELTEQKFIDDPFKQGKRLYKTGDLVRWLEDGSIEFMGRMDHQVKIRGFRVECGEIETALLALDSIKHAVVLAKQINGSTQLIAFAVQNEAENTLNTRALKQALIVSLPDYMIPSVFVSVEHIPLTASRKVDSKALMQLDVDADENHRYIAPRTEIESQLAEIWQQVLNVERIGVHDNFFDLGGHSLLSVRLMAVIQKRFDKELPISSLFQASDIAAQAQLLQQNVKPWTPLVCLQPKGKEPPFFCIHAVGGSILCYQELSQSMGEQRPFYGLQAPNSDAEEYPETIEELAALYIIEIRSVQAQGPYQLGGWSMGGVIAYEIARQLEQEGEQVSTLVLIESHTPGAVQAFEQDYIKTHMQHSDGDSETLLLMAFARDLGLGDVEKIVSRSASQYTLTQQLDVIFKQAKQGGLLLADIDSEQLHRLFSVFAANVQAMNNYTPQQYQGSIKLFYVNNANRGVSAPDYAKAEGWSELVQGELHTEKVSGDHYSLLRQPNVQILADKLTGYMDEKNN